MPSAFVCEYPRDLQNNDNAYPDFAFYRVFCFDLRIAMWLLIFGPLALLLGLPKRTDQA